MIKSIFFTVIISILFFTQFIIAQGDFYNDSKCENSIKFLEDNCITCNNENIESKCKVEEFKALGKVNNHYYYSAITLGYDAELDYRNDGKFNIGNVRIFEGINDKEKVKLVYYTGGYIGVFEHVFIELVSTRNNNFIHIGVSDGNGHWDSGEYFIFKKNGWYKLDVPEAADTLKFIIPKTYKFCKGSRVDLNKMISDISVYTPNDACCCPTGGTARAYLKLTHDNKIIITKTKYIPELN